MQYTYMTDHPCTKIIRSTIILPQFGAGGRVIHQHVISPVKLVFENRVCFVDEAFAAAHKNPDGSRMTLAQMVELIEEHDDFYREGVGGGGYNKFRLVASPDMEITKEDAQTMEKAAKSTKTQYQHGPVGLDKKAKK